MFKKFKPVTPGTRQLVLPAFDELTTQGELSGKKLEKAFDQIRSFHFSKRVLAVVII